MEITTNELASMRLFYDRGATLSYRFRKQQLEKLLELVEIFEAEIAAALHADLKKPTAEIFTTEIGFVYNEIKHAICNLCAWMETETVKTPFFLQPSNSKIVKSPLGVVFIISPWNYPFQLLLSPLIGAIAAGNCVVLKPSELAPNTSHLIANILNSNFSNNYIRAIEGEGATIVPAIMNAFRFNHVFFTGSETVGKAVATIAAQHLTPVTLELGGKSPCIVCADANLAIAAKRIVWGKFLNAGQTCVAPDYLLVHESRYAELIDDLKIAIQQFYTANPQQSPDYARIINEKEFNRLSDYLQQGTIICGGETDKTNLYIAPTLLANIAQNQSILNEEVFGPILPIFTFKTNTEAVAFINKNPNPLSLYVFTESIHNQNYYIDNIAFGGGCINDTLVQVANYNLPFGGVGASGIGKYHGKHSFDTFSHCKAVVTTTTAIDITIKYPPFGKKLRWIKMLLD